MKAILNKQNIFLKGVLTLLSKQQAKKKVLDYLKTSMISYKLCNKDEHSGVLVDMKKPYKIHLCASIPEVVGGRIETLVIFCDECLLCKTYYCQPIANNEKEANKVARIINYINANLVYYGDDLYNYTFILDETGYVMDIFLIRYELLEKYFQESMNHILSYSVQKLVDIYPAIMPYKTGEINYYTATKIRIDHDIAGKKI